MRKGVLVAVTTFDLHLLLLLLLLPLHSVISEGKESSSQTSVTYHSQHGQEKYVVEEVLRGLRGGYFVELGVADALTLSNTLSLESWGWNGLCIEPSIAYTALLGSGRR